MVNTILVCTGNICRSPIAEGLLKAALAHKQVLSAGTMAMVGDGADPLSVQVSADHALDISKHRAQQLTLAMLQAADLVLTLDALHSQWINRRYPQFRDKVHQLGKWQNDADVPDPYRQPKAAFEAVFQQMDSQVREWVERVQ